jgi:hypothetical protein
VQRDRDQVARVTDPSCDGRRSAQVIGECLCVLMASKVALNHQLVITFWSSPAVGLLAVAVNPCFRGSAGAQVVWPPAAWLSGGDPFPVHFDEVDFNQVLIAVR